MIPRVLCSLVALCLSLSVRGLPQAVGPSETVPSAEGSQIDVDEHGVEWVTVVDDPTPVVETTAGRLAGPPKCKKLQVRKEWRDMTPKHRKDYINAVKCLQNTRAHNETLPTKFTRYDEFVMTHSNVAEQIHGVAQFLPWHRHFGYLYQKDLKEICHYHGPAPYWDWTRDTSGTDPISASPIFDPVTGFGGVGEPGTYTLPTSPPDTALHPLSPAAYQGDYGCISNGPFHGTIVHYGPNPRATDHCIVRTAFFELVRPVLTTANVANTLAQTTYDQFWNSLDGFPFKPVLAIHDAGHAYIGGDMGSFYTSNNEPIFYLHHSGVDRVWWEWQSADLNQRLYAMEGQTSPYAPHGSITLDWELPFDGFSADLPVRDTMDIRNEPYCYTY